MRARIRIPVIPLGCLVMLLLGWAGFRQLMKPFRSDPEPLRSLTEVAQMTGISFPPGSQLVDGSICRCWNAYLYARIRLAPHEVPRLWRQPSFEEMPSATENALAMNVPADLWRQWRLGDVQDFRSARGGSLQRKGISQALVSLDDPSHPLLHLYWFSN
jgi:hypothetical protein